MQPYTCSCCGAVHEDWPALIYRTPEFYHQLSEHQKEQHTEIDDDFCVVKLDDEVFRFIRVTMVQTVNDHCQNLDYGLWVSLSEKSFTDYSDNYRNEHHEVVYFGWLNNFLPEYDDYTSIPTTVYTQKGNKRPIIVPHSDFDHPLVKDYYEGITAQEAKQRIDRMLGNQKN